MSNCINLTRSEREFAKAAGIAEQEYPLPMKDIAGNVSSGQVLANSFASYIRDQIGKVISTEKKRGDYAEANEILSLDGIDRLGENDYLIVNSDEKLSDEFKEKNKDNIIIVPSKPRYATHKFMINRLDGVSDIMSVSSAVETITDFTIHVEGRTGGISGVNNRNRSKGRAVYKVGDNYQSIKKQVDSLMTGITQNSRKASADETIDVFLRLEVLNNNQEDMKAAFDNISKALMEYSNGENKYSFRLHIKADPNSDTAVEVLEDIVNNSDSRIMLVYNTTAGASYISSDGSLTAMPENILNRMSKYQQLEDPEFMGAMSNIVSKIGDNKNRIFYRSNAIYKDSNSNESAIARKIHGTLSNLSKEEIDSENKYKAIKVDRKGRGIINKIARKSNVLIQKKRTRDEQEHDSNTVGSMFGKASNDGSYLSTLTIGAIRGLNVDEIIHNALSIDDAIYGKKDVYDEIVKGSKLYDFLTANDDKRFVENINNLVERLEALRADDSSKKDKAKRDEIHDIKVEMARIIASEIYIPYMKLQIYSLNVVEQEALNRLFKGGNYMISTEANDVKRILSPENAISQYYDNVEVGLHVVNRVYSKEKAEFDNTSGEVNVVVNENSANLYKMVSIIKGSSTHTVFLSDLSSDTKRNKIPMSEGKHYNPKPKANNYSIVSKLGLKADGEDSPSNVAAKTIEDIKDSGTVINGNTITIGISGSTLSSISPNKHGIFYPGDFNERDKTTVDRLKTLMGIPQELESNNIRFSPNGGSDKVLDRAGYILYYLRNLKRMIEEEGGELGAINVTYADGLDVFAIMAASMLGIKTNILVSSESKVYSIKVAQGGASKPIYTYKRYDTSGVMDRLKAITTLSKQAIKELNEEYINGVNETFDEAGRKLDNSYESSVSTTDAGHEIVISQRMPDVEVKKRGRQLVHNFIRALNGVSTVLGQLQSEKEELLENGASSDGNEINRINKKISLYSSISSRTSRSNMRELLRDEFMKYKRRLELEQSRDDEKRSEYRISKIEDILANSRQIIDNALNVIMSGEYSPILDDFSGDEKSVLDLDYDMEEDSNSEDTDEEARDNELFGGDKNNKPTFDSLSNLATAIMYTIEEKDSTGSSVYTDIGEIKFFDGYNIKKELSRELAEAKDEADFIRILKRLARTKPWGKAFLRRIKMRSAAYVSLYNSMSAGNIQYAIVNGDGGISILNEANGFQSARSEITSIIESSRVIGGTPIYTDNAEENMRNALAIAGYKVTKNKDTNEEVISGENTNANAMYKLKKVVSTGDKIQVKEFNVNNLSGKEIFNLITMYDIDDRDRYHHIIEDNIKNLVGYMNSLGLDINEDDIKREIFEVGTYDLITEEDDDIFSGSTGQPVSKNALSIIFNSLTDIGNDLVYQVARLNDPNGSGYSNDENTFINGNIEPTGANARHINRLAREVLSPFRAGQNLDKVVIDGKVFYGRVKPSYMSRLNKSLSKSEGETNEYYAERIRRVLDGSSYILESDNTEENKSEIPESHGWVAGKVNPYSEHSEELMKVIEVKKISKGGSDFMIPPTKASIQDLILSNEHMYYFHKGRVNTFNKREMDEVTALPIPVLADSGHLQYITAERIYPISVPKVLGTEYLNSEDDYEIQKYGPSHFHNNISEIAKRKIIERIASRRADDSMLASGMWVMYSSFATEIERMIKLSLSGGETGDRVFDNNGKKFIYSPSINGISITKEQKKSIKEIAPKSNGIKQKIDSASSIYDIIDALASAGANRNTIYQVVDNILFDDIYDAIEKDIRESVNEYQSYRYEQFDIKPDASKKVKFIEGLLEDVKDEIESTSKRLSKSNKWIELDELASKLTGVNVYKMSEDGQAPPSQYNEIKRGSSLALYIEQRYLAGYYKALVDLMNTISSRGFVTGIDLEDFEASMNRVAYDIRVSISSNQDGGLEGSDKLDDILVSLIEKSKFSTSEPISGLKKKSDIISEMSALSTEEKQSGLSNYSDLVGYVVNANYGMIQAIQLYSEDAAYYKSVVDFFKRIKQISAQSSPVSSAKIEKGEFVVGGRGTSYRMAVIDDELVLSTSMPEFKKILSNKVSTGEMTQSEADSIIEKYQENSTTDGASFRTMRSMVDILERSGKPEAKNLRRILEKYEAGLQEMVDKNLQNASEISSQYKLTKEDYSSVFNAFKPYFYGTRTNLRGNTKFRAPIQVKDSEVLLAVSGILSYVNGEGFSRLQEYEMKAKELGIDVIVFHSSIKVGGRDSFSSKDFLAMSSSDIDNELTNGFGRVLDMDYENYGLQLDVSLHTGISSEGSQRRVLTISGLDMDGTYYVDGKKMTGQQIYDEYHSIITYRLLKGLEEIHKVLGTKEGNKKLSEFLMGEARKTSRLAGSDILDHFELDANGNFRMPLTDPAIASIVEPMISSFIRKNMGGRKVRGTTLVQFTSYAMHEDLRTIASGDIISKDNPNGFFHVEDIRTYFDKVVVPAGEFNGALYTKDDYDRFVEENVKPGSIGIKALEAIMPAMYEEILSDFIDENGFIDPTLLPKGALESIGFRTPTEDKYSILSIKIKAFSPSVTGGNIILPSDITTMTGADFDIDKLYMVIKNLEFKDINDLNEEIFKPEGITNEEEKFEKIKSIVKGSVMTKFADGELTQDELNIVEGKIKQFAKDVLSGKKSIPTEIKYDKDKVEKDGPQSMSYEQMDNRLIDLSMAVIQSTSNAHKAIRPRNYTRLKKLALVTQVINNFNNNDIIKAMTLYKVTTLTNKTLYDSLSAEDVSIKQIDDILCSLSINPKFISAIHQSKVFAYMSTIKTNVAISSNAATAHAKMNKMNLTLKNGIEFLDKIYYKVDHPYDEKQRYISRTLAMLISVATDKDPMFENLNINSYFLTMVRLGIDVNDIVKFMSNNHVRSILRVVKRWGIDSEISAIRELINKNINEIEKLRNEAAKESGLTIQRKSIEDEAKSYTLDTDVMNSISNKASESELSNKEYIAILNFLERIAPIQSELNLITTLWKFDTSKGFFGPNYSDAAYQMHAMESLRTRSSKEVYPISGISEFMEKLAGIEFRMKQGDISQIELAKMINETKAPIVAAYYLTGVTSVSDIIKKHSHVLSDDFNSVMYGSNSISSISNRITRDMIKDAAKGYVLYKISRSEKLFKGRDGMPAAEYYYSKFPSEFDRFIYNNSDKVSDMDMFKIMYVDKSSNERNGVIKLNEGVEMTPDTRAAFQASWLDLYSMGGIYSDMAMKLAVYAIMSSGFNYRADKFSTLIPMQILESLDNYVNNIGTGSELTEMDRDRFVDQFIRHAMNRDYADNVSNPIVLSGRLRRGVTVDSNTFAKTGMLRFDMSIKANKFALLSKNTDTGDMSPSKYIRVYSNSRSSNFAAFRLKKSDRSSAIYEPIDSLGAADFVNEYSALFDTVQSSVSRNRYDENKIMDVSEASDSNEPIFNAVKAVMEAISTGDESLIDEAMDNVLISAALSYDSKGQSSIIEAIDNILRVFVEDNRESVVGLSEAEETRTRILKYVEDIKRGGIIDKENEALCD